jgi:hypothetical protein
VSSFGAGAHQVGAGGQVGGDVAQNDPEATPEAVPDNGGPDLPTDGEGHAGRGAWVIGHPGDGQRTVPTTSSATEGLEGPAAPDPPDQADSRLRPLRRRDLMIACPARSDMRCRKPCFLARLRVFGWYVRFTHCLLGPGVSSGVVQPGST